MNETRHRQAAWIPVEHIHALGLQSAMPTGLLPQPLGATRKPDSPPPRGRWGACRTHVKRLAGAIEARRTWPGRVLPLGAAHAGTEHRNRGVVSALWSY